MQRGRGSSLRDQSFESRVVLLSRSLRSSNGAGSEGRSARKTTREIPSDVQVHRPQCDNVEQIDEGTRATSKKATSDDDTGASAKRPGLLPKTEDGRGTTRQASIRCWSSGVDCTVCPGGGRELYRANSGRQVYTKMCLDNDERGRTSTTSRMALEDYGGHLDKPPPQTSSSNNAAQASTLYAHAL
jgi:hypothetical protein